MKEKVYMDCSFNMSTKKMADVLYAAIMTEAGLPTTFTLAREYNRRQNAYNTVWVKVHIKEDKIAQFEEMTGLNLKVPISVTVNCNNESALHPRYF